MKEKDSVQKDRTPSRFKRGLFVVAGTIFLGLGSLGIFLPILPTTPFLLLSAACYYKGSKRMHNWMMNNKWFGKYVRNYMEGKGISFQTKLFTIGFLWATIVVSVFFFVDILVVQIVLFMIAIVVSIHIITLPTFKKI
jgi:uncharacterized membrane protein YbaN (DUF454 family)